MHRLIYRSVATTQMSTTEISDIVVRAQRRNERDGITGMLLFHRGTFFQVLEGDKSTVHACYQRVSKDPRHRNVFKISDRPANSRAFTTWFMGYENVKDLLPTARQKALSIKEIERRLDTVGAMDDVVEGKKALVQQLANFLAQTNLTSQR